MARANRWQRIAGICLPLLKLGVLLGAVYITGWLAMRDDWRDVEELPVRFAYVDHGPRGGERRTKPFHLDLCEAAKACSGGAQALASIPRRDAAELDEIRAQYKPSGTTVPFAVFVLLCAGLISAAAQRSMDWLYRKLGLFSKRMVPQEDQVRHILSEHGWLCSYGLARMHTETNSPRNHYYRALQLVTDAYRRHVQESHSGAQLRISLFWSGTMSDLRDLLNDETSGDDLRELYEYWNRLGGDDKGAFDVRRYFITTAAEYGKAMSRDGAWYGKYYPNVKPHLVPARNREINGYLARLEDDPDFALFDGGEYAVCLGFCGDRLTYVLLENDDGMLPRQQLAGTLWRRMNAKPQATDSG